MGVEHSKEEILSTLHNHHRHHHECFSNNNTNNESEEEEEDAALTKIMAEHSTPLELYSLAFDSASTASAATTSSNLDQQHLQQNNNSHNRSIYRKWKKASSNSTALTSSTSTTTSSSLAYSKKSILRPSSYFRSSYSPSHQTTRHSTSTIYRLLLQNDYTSLIQHLQKHPQDIYESQVSPLYNVVRKVLPIHLACAARAPINIVKLCVGDDKDVIEVEVEVEEMEEKREEIVMTPVVNLQVIHETNDHNDDAQAAAAKATTEQHTEEEKRETIKIDETTNNWLPLHIAVYFHSPPSVINYLLSIAPQAAKCKMGGGYLPIHFLCANLPPPYPPSLSKEEEEKQNYELLSSLHFLLRAFPDSIHVPSTPPSPNPHETPLQLVKRCFEPSDTKEKMMRLLNVSSGLPPPPPLLQSVMEINVEQKEHVAVEELQMGEDAASTHSSYHGGSTGSRGSSSQRTGKASIQSFTTVPVPKMYRQLQSSSMSTSNIDASTSISSSSTSTSSSSTKKKRHKSFFRSLPIHHRRSTSIFTSPNKSSSSSSTTTTSKSLAHHHQQHHHKKQQDLVDPNKPTKLYTHISNRDWKAASARLHKCPHEASVWTLFDIVQQPITTAATTLPPTMEGDNESQDNDDTAPAAFASTGNEKEKEEEYGCHRLPLHKACTLKPPLTPFFTSLYDAYPDAVTSKEKYGMLPLHVACQDGASYPIISFLLQKYTAAASIPDNFGLLPLHLACTEGAPVSVVVELLRAYPNGISVKDERGRSPMDYVRESYHPNRKVLMSVLERTDPLFWLAPRISSGKKSKSSEDGNHRENENENNGGEDENVKIPPLYTMVQKKQWEKVNAYLNQDDNNNEHDDNEKTHKHNNVTSTTTTQESRHFETKLWVLDESYDTMIPRLPIHLACANRAPPSIVSTLLSINPSSIMAKEKHDQIPLHIAVSIGSIDLVSLLVKQYPEGAKCQDSYGLLPIHVACTEGVSVQIVELLLKAYPESSNVGDKRGNTPISFAEASFHPGKKGVLEILKKDVSFWIEQEEEEIEPKEDEEEVVDNNEKEEDEEDEEEEEEEPPEKGIIEIEQDNVKKDSVHWLIDGKEWDLIPQRLEEYPDEARELLVTIPTTQDKDDDNTTANVEEEEKEEQQLETEENNDKQLPLHRICTHRPKRYLIRSLLKVYPNATQVKTFQTQELPLHLAVRNDAWAQVVELLIESYPQGLWKADRMERLALHGACIAGASVSVIKTLLDAAAAAATTGDNKDEKKKDITKVKDLDGLTPIDYVERSSHPHKSSILSLLEEHGKNNNDDDDDFKKQKDSSTLPPVANNTTTITATDTTTELCQHIQNKEWVAVVTRCREHPEEASVWMMMKKKKKNMVVVMANNNSTNDDDDLGTEPLSSSSSFSPPSATKGGEKMDCAGGKEEEEERSNSSGQYLPIHLACALQPPTRIIASLHSAYPNGTSTKEHVQDRYPLHIACQYEASLEVITLLIKLYPDAISKRDKFGLLPIHVACSTKKADIEVIKVLLRAAPGSFAAKDKKGWTALEYAELSHHPNHFLTLMEELSSDVLLGGHRRRGMLSSRSVPTITEDGFMTIRRRRSQQQGMFRSVNNHLGGSSRSGCFDMAGGGGAGQIPLATQ